MQEKSQQPSDTPSTPALQFRGTAQDLRRWLAAVEAGAWARSVPQSQWADVAISFLEGDLKAVMAAQRASQKGDWDWADFKKCLVGLVEEAERLARTPLEVASDSVEQFRRDHPYVAAAAGLGLVVGGSAILLPAIGLAALNAVGFTASGVAGGSIAAATQSAVYGGLTTGLFSTFQSIAATSVMATIPSIAAAAGAVGGGLGVLLRTVRRDNSPSDSA